jgi:cobalt-zinc-cadmium efflux system membrane fusion protein
MIPHRAALLSLMSIAAACGREAAADVEHLDPHVTVREVSDSATFTVGRADRFPLVAVTARAVADRLSGTCSVVPDVNRTIPVNALSGGRVVNVRATLGDRVRKGQTLMTISSPDLSSALADYVKASADESLARKILDRSRALLEHGSIAKKDLEVAEDTEQKARADLGATEQRVRLLGGEPGATSPMIELTSPIDGTIIEQNVAPGAAVKSLDNSPNLFTVADLSRVWVLCDVYENELGQAHVGQPARVRLNAFPEGSYTGRIANVSQVLDPATRTAKVRIELDNSDGRMRPGMFGVADLESAAARDRLVLPTTALVQLHDADWVFVRAGPGAFRRVKVRPGRQLEPGLQEIVNGLTTGQQVVRNALQFVQAVEQ